MTDDQDLEATEKTNLLPFDPEKVPQPKSALKPLQQPKTKVAKKWLPTDRELADRWLKKYPDTVWARGDFYRCTNSLWAVHDLVETEIEKILAKSEKDEGTRPTGGQLGSIMRLAKAKVRKKDDIFAPKDSDYLHCANGILHIPTRVLDTNSRPELYLTKGVSYAYDPESPSPGWDRLMHWYMRNVGAETVAFLQEFAGYALTYNMDHDISIWMVGPPGGGKSTFILGLQTALSDRAMTLSLKDISTDRFALGDIPGHTFAFCEEQPADYRAATDMFNKLAAGGTVRVERKREHAYDCKSTLKFLFAMQHKPEIGAGDGAFRRLRVVDIPPFAESEKDESLRPLIESEGTGILNWCLDGLERLKNRGRFVTPDSVKLATKEYKDLGDPVKDFLDECCTLGADLRVSSAELYDRYKRWAKDGERKPLLSSNRIIDHWKRHGLTKHMVDGRAFWQGVMLKDGLPDPVVCDY